MFPTLLVILALTVLYWFPARLLTHAIEPAGFVMTRRMLLGLKQRAEALCTEVATRPRRISVWPR